MRYNKYIKNKVSTLGFPISKPLKASYKYFIIIPAYNENEYIHETLKCISAQHYLDQLVMNMIKIF